MNSAPAPGGAKPLTTVTHAVTAAGHGAKELVLDPVKLAASASGAVAATLAGSAFGDTGTLIGVAAGAVISGGIASCLEHTTRHARKAAAGKVAAGKAVVAGKHPFTTRLRRPSLVQGIAAMALTAGSMLGGVAIAEQLTGRTVHGVITNSTDYGSTFTGHTPVSPQPPAPSPSPFSFSLSPSPSALHSPAPSVSFSPLPASSPVVASSPPSSTPSLPASSPAATPSPSPSLSPSSTPSSPAPVATSSGPGSASMPPSSSPAATPTPAITSSGAAPG